MNAIKDKIHQRALQTMIETYGQTPLQLFTNAHPKRFSKSSPLSDVLPHAVDLIKDKLPKDRVLTGDHLNPEGMCVMTLVLKITKIAKIVYNLF